ncbi:hypothetical protein VOLCADRAFT_90670, partial [Volvox carteri f. nagariensis]
MLRNPRCKQQRGLERICRLEEPSHEPLIPSKKTMEWARIADVPTSLDAARADAPSQRANAEHVPTASPAPCACLPVAKGLSSQAALAAPTTYSAGCAQQYYRTPARTDQQPGEGDAPAAEASSSGAGLAAVPELPSPPRDQADITLAANCRSSGHGNARDSSPQQPAGHLEGGAVAAGAADGAEDMDGAAPPAGGTPSADPMDISPSDRPLRPAATTAAEAGAINEAGDAATASMPVLAHAHKAPDDSNATTATTATVAAAAPPATATIAAGSGEGAGGPLGETAAGKEDAPRPSKRRRTGSSNGAMMKELKGLLESSMYDVPSGRSRQASRAASTPPPAMLAAAAAVRQALPTAALAAQVPAEVIAAATAAFAAPPAPRVAALAAAAAVSSTLASGKRPVTRKSDAAATAAAATATGLVAATDAAVSILENGASAPAAGADTDGPTTAVAPAAGNGNGSRRQRDNRNTSARKPSTVYGVGTDGGGSGGGRGASAAVVAGGSSTTALKPVVPASAQGAAGGGSKSKTRGGGGSGGGGGTVASNNAVPGLASGRPSRAKGGSAAGCGAGGAGGAGAAAASAAAAPSATKATGTLPAGKAGGAAPVGKAVGPAPAGTVVAGITPAAAAAASAAAADGRISLAGLGCGLNQYTYYPLRGSNIMTFYPGAIVVAHVGRLPNMRRPNDPAVPGVACVPPVPLLRLSPDVPPAAAPPPRGRPLYLPGRRRRDGENGGAATVAGGDELDDLGLKVAAKAAASGEDGIPPSGAGKVCGGANDADDLKQEGQVAGLTIAIKPDIKTEDAEACGVAAAMASVAAEAVATRKVSQEQVMEGAMAEMDDAYYQAIYDAEMAEQAAIGTEASDGEVAEEVEVVKQGEEHEEKAWDEEGGEADDENDIGVFRSVDGRRPLQRHLYGLLAAAPAGAASGDGGSSGGSAANARRGSNVPGCGGGGGGVPCGGALSTAGCSQVIPSFAFSRRLTAPRLYWSSQYQAQVPPPPPGGSEAAAAVLRRRPPSPAALSRMGVPLHSAQPLSAAAAAVAARTAAEAAEAVQAARAALGYTAGTPGEAAATTTAGRPATAAAAATGKSRPAAPSSRQRRSQQRVVKMEVDEPKLDEQGGSGEPSDEQMDERAGGASPGLGPPVPRGEGCAEDPSCGHGVQGPGGGPQAQPRQQVPVQDHAQGAQMRMQGDTAEVGAAPPDSDREASPGRSSGKRPVIDTERQDEQDGQQHPSQQQQEQHVGVEAEKQQEQKEQQGQEQRRQQQDRKQALRQPHHRETQKQHKQQEAREQEQEKVILFPADGGLLGGGVRRQLAAAPDMARRHVVMDAALRQADQELGDMAQVLGVGSMGARVRGQWSRDTEAAFADLMRQRDTRLGHLIK